MRPENRLTVNIVGPGRLGRTVHQRLTEQGHHVRLIGRGEAIPAAPITWLTVPDRSIAAAASRVPPGGARLHASGAATLDVLGPADGRGSLHPLMTFPGPETAPLVQGQQVPAAVDGDDQGRAAATALAHALGFTPFPVPGDRRAYHAAAVIAGNFATTLLAVASRVLAQAGVPESEGPALLAPLALQSIRNASATSPSRALTGPVVRGDEAVIAGHLACLRPRDRVVYEVLLQASRELVGVAPEDDPQ